MSVDHNREDNIEGGKPSSTPENSLTKKIFLNLLIGMFFLMVYFYFSQSFGSISTSFIKNPELSIQFGATLLIFTFLSVLAGPIRATILGFLGELIYQLSFYESLKIEWSIIVALIGLTVSIYKYKPLKYKDGIKVYYTFLTLMISSVLISVLIGAVQFIISPSMSLETIIGDYGFNYFMQALLSIVFIVPFLLLLYDRFLAKKERHIYHLFLTHHPIYQSDHTFFLKFGRTYIYFCSRCSGAILGGIFTAFLIDILRKAIGFSISPELAVWLCIFLPIPGIIDWGTQRLLYRKSTTESRLFTGFIIGVALYFLAFTDQYYFFMLFLVIFYFSLVGILMWLGQKRALKQEQEAENNIPSFEEDQYE
ncbi:MAG: conserved membrane protein of unknown function [Promethearchaeota archaeon]|nr:MAG: conserved membrane protein of unknown function [Candidatus Lokiarchaeota archaeon]